ncbi:MAG: preprotein translocase subunit YajC [Planctomycetes bacterium]|nr:preprotein translocase subunit YajC [Planctomycetota bacterium]
MNLPFALIQEAAAPAGPAGPQSIFSSFGGIIPIVACFAVFWFIILRPEQKARKKRAAMLAQIKKGDDVMTTGGLFGTVVQVQDDRITLQVAEGTRLRFARSAIQQIESESSDKAIEAKTTNA